MKMAGPRPINAQISRTYTKSFKPGHSIRNPAMAATDGESSLHPQQAFISNQGLDLDDPEPSEDMYFNPKKSKQPFSKSTPLKSTAFAFTSAKKGSGARAPKFVPTQPSFQTFTKGKIQSHTNSMEGRNIIYPGDIVP
jgi:hypothetical protein